MRILPSKMCYNSLYKNACYNTDCKFRHVRGTWKKEPGDVEILKRTDQGFGNHQPQTNNMGTNNTRNPKDFLEILRLLQIDMQQMNNQLLNIMKNQNQQSPLQNTHPIQSQINTTNGRI